MARFERVNNRSGVAGYLLATIEGHLKCIWRLKKATVSFDPVESVATA